MKRTTSPRTLSRRSLKHRVLRCYTVKMEAVAIVDARNAADAYDRATKDIAHGRMMGCIKPMGKNCGATLAQNTPISGGANRPKDL
jgi:hypothetical protein